MNPNQTCRKKKLIGRLPPPIICPDPRGNTFPAAENSWCWIYREDNLSLFIFWRTRQQRRNFLFKFYWLFFYCNFILLLYIIVNWPRVLTLQVWFGLFGLFSRSNCPELYFENIVFSKLYFENIVFSFQYLFWEVTLSFLFPRYSWFSLFGLFYRIKCLYQMF